MKTSISILVNISVVFAIGLSAFSSFASIEDKLKAAMASDIRSTNEVDRDRNRKPIETLQFFGIQEDMSIVELVPGGGWYTKLLVPLLNEKGNYYGAIGATRIETNLADAAGFERMNVIAKDAKIFREEGARFYTLEATTLGVDNIDMILTFRNYHNFNDQGRAVMNKLAFDALKSGGIYGVLDHSARHMEPMTNSNRRRMDPVKAIKEIQDAGFILVDYSTIHYREDDELRYEVGTKSVTGNSDRWTIKFMKP
jgi:predicted methyltransferase